MLEKPEIHFDLFAVPGVRLGTACAGIKKADRRDLVIFELAEGTTTAAVFTRNAFCAAPVTVAKQHLAQNQPRYLLINTGNANAGTGKQGLTDALACCQALAEEVDCAVNEILPFSTGVIGQNLPVDKISKALPQALLNLDEMGWENAAHGIMTTDTVAKGATRKFSLHGEEITVSGIAKGSGMIRPDMATMLAYIVTDAKVDSGLLQRCLKTAVDRSFNRISVDGDTSTNDAVVLSATGQARVSFEQANEDFQSLQQAVNEVCEELAQAIVRDGEGATKLITIEVLQAKDEQEALQIAYTVAHSPLVKTAFFASDPNWGRILAAVGRAGVINLDIDAIQIYLGDVCIVREGGKADDYTEERGQQVMDQSEITITIQLNRGQSQARVWTCDFSYDYVRINAEYRT